jgi:hypothetical protein
MSGCPSVAKLPAGIIADRVGIEDLGILRIAVEMLVKRFTKPPVTRCIMYTADSIARLVESYTERVTYVIEVPEGEFGAVNEAVLRILRGLGHVELLYWKNQRYAILTPLGEVVRDFVKDERIPENARLHALIISSFPFSTKMRVVYGLYYMHGVGYGGFYATLKDKIFRYDWERKLLYYKGVERPALEVLMEMAFTRAGHSEKAVSETELLTMLLDMYAQRFGGKQRLNELFRAVNHHLRFKHHDKFDFEVAAWEALGPGVYPILDKVLEEHGLTSLRPLIDRLEKEFARIEYTLYCLCMMPMHLS